MTAVADLTPAQQADLYSQVGNAMNNPGFNYDAHVAANTVAGVFVAPTNNPPAAPASNSAVNGNPAGIAAAAAAGGAAASASSASTIAGLTKAELDSLYAQVGDAMYNAGFNYAAHIAANTINGVFVPPSNNASSTTGTTVTTMVGAGVQTSTIAGLTKAELDSLYAQVGDAMYATGFSYAAHIAGNTVNGVFTPPVYIPADTSSMLAVPAVGSEAYQALMAETGGAAANPGFNYAAHVAATVSQSRQDLSYDDVLRLVKETGSADVSKIDLVAYRAATGSTVGLSNSYLNPVAAQVATTQMASSDILKMPAVGSEAYQALLTETGGASANPGFNYAAHVAANTSQKVLTSLSYSEVMTLIAQTGRSDFSNFDLAGYQKDKAMADPLVNRLVAAPTSAAVAAPAAGTPEYQKLLQDTGLKDLTGFDYKAYLSAKHEADVALATLQGTAGDDVIVAAANDKKDIFVLGQGNDTLTATNSADIMVGGQGNDNLDGGSGVDKAAYSGTSKDYKVTIGADGKVTVADAVANRDGTDALVGVERVSFADKSLAFDINGNAGAGYRLYKAAFDRQPDPAGLGYWMHALDGGANLANDVANGFLASKEFQDLYGANTTTTTFINNLYQNVLHRTPDAEGAAYWERTIEAGVSRASILTNFSDSNENIDQVATLVGNGITYTEYVA